MAVTTAQGRCERCGGPVPQAPVRIGGLELQRTLLRADDGWQAQLTWSQAEVLRALARWPGQVITLDQLLAVMPGPVRSIGSLRQVMRQIRRVVGHRLILRSSKGVGYFAYPTPPPGRS